MILRRLHERESLRRCLLRKKERERERERNWCGVFRTKRRKVEYR